MILGLILLGTLLGGVISVLLATVLALTTLRRFADRMVAFAVGVMLTFALVDLWPESLHLGLDPEDAGIVMLLGLLAFFMLEKAALWRHDHQHLHRQLHGHLHSHQKGMDVSRAALSTTPPRAQPQVALIVLGDGLHNFVDGILIAAAFLADPALGWATSLAVLAHEIPQEISDFMVLLNAGVTRRRALLLNTLSGFAAVAGGVVGYFVLQQAQALVPYALVVSAASFIYIAVADLVPALHEQRERSDWAIQGVLLVLGSLAVFGIVRMAHHSH